MGQALARKLLARGDHVVVASRQDRPGRVGDFESVDACDAQAVASLIERHSDLSGVANLVGSLLLKPAHLTKVDEWNSVMQTHLFSSFFICQSAARAMMARGGSMLFVSSVAAQLGLPNHEAIAAAKGGIEALVRSAAATYASKKIRINAVAPGLTETPLIAQWSQATRDLSAKMHPMGRIGQVQDVVPAMELLLCDADWVTGQVWSVDGGLSRVKASG
jgi:3-oxoacyl-[acyl-carrier protein] reductase